MRTGCLLCWAVYVTSFDWRIEQESDEFVGVACPKVYLSPILVLRAVAIGSDTPTEE